MMRKEIGLMGAILVGIIAVAWIGSSYFRNDSKPAANTAASRPLANLIRDDSLAMGPTDAAVTVVEFLDPECESCAAFAPAVKKVVDENKDRVRLVVRYVPLHPNSARAITLIEAAAEQGKGWQALDILLAKQGEWGDRHGAPSTSAPPDVPKLFESYARAIGLDLEKYLASVRENRFVQKIERDRRDATEAGVRQTPTIFVNGKRLAKLNENDLRSMVAAELAK